MEELSFDTINKLVLWDIQSTYSRYGNKIYYQREGLPIGGICSSIYADIQCSFDEHNFLQSLHTNLLKEVVAVRQIDDLLILTKHTSIKEGISQCYNKGLELEEQHIDKDYDEKGELVQTFEFIGINCSLRKGLLKAKVANKNWESLISNKTQIKPRFAPISCYRSKSLYKQVIEGALYRVRDYSIGGKEITKAIRELKYEFECIGYPQNMFSSVLKKFIKVKIEENKRKSWTKVI